MLQQTRAEYVTQRFEAFLARFPTLKALAQATEEEVLKAWAGLGYYRRARLLWEAARCAHKAGGLPRTAQELRSLPGIGPYTAAAVASIAYGQAVPATDANAVRVLARVLGKRGDQHALAKAVGPLHQALVQAAAHAGNVNQALMDVGSRLCRPRRTHCRACPLAPWCQAASLGEEVAVTLGPSSRPPRRTPWAVVMAVLRAPEGEVLCLRRPGGLLGGTWGLPSWGEELPRDEEGQDLGRQQAWLRGEEELAARWALHTPWRREGEFGWTFTHRQWWVRVVSAPLVHLPTGPGVRLCLPDQVDQAGLASVDRRALAVAGVEPPSRPRRE
jgi:A/G-specific adenine glycosylase